jgi:hypothetical protein
MPANHHIDNEAQLIVTTWEGEARDIEFMVAIKKYQRDIQNHPDYISYNEVLNLSKITGIKVTTKGLKTIGQIGTSTDRNDVNRKLAIIVSSKLAYGLSRMYITYRSFSKNSRKEIQVFNNEKDAFEWVKK